MCYLDLTFVSLLFKVQLYKIHLIYFSLNDEFSTRSHPTVSDNDALLVHWCLILMLKVPFSVCIWRLNCANITLQRSVSQKHVVLIVIILKVWRTEQTGGASHAGQAHQWMIMDQGVRKLTECWNDDWSAGHWGVLQPIVCIDACASWQETVGLL